MHLINWFVSLIAAFAGVMYFCARPPRHRSLEYRLRRARAKRSLLQAVCVFWAALLLIVRSLLTLDTLPFFHVSPTATLALAATLVAVALYLVGRAIRLFRPRRIFRLP